MEDELSQKKKLSVDGTLPKKSRIDKTKTNFSLSDSEDEDVMVLATQGKSLSYYHIFSDCILAYQRFIYHSC